MPPFLAPVRAKRAGEETDANPRPNKRPSLGAAPVQEQFWMVQWRHPQARKNKTWDGDAVLAVEGTKCTMFDMDGRIIGSGSTDLGRKVRVGDALKVGGKELEIDCTIEAHEFLSGKCFNSGRPSTSGSGVVSTPQPSAQRQKQFKALVPGTSVSLSSPVLSSKASPASLASRSYPPSHKTNVSDVFEDEDGCPVIQIVNPGKKREIPESLWRVNWRKSSMKKNKTWDGDGMIHQVGNTIKFLSEDGKKVYGSRKWDTGLSAGSFVQMSEKEIQIESWLSMSALTNNGRAESEEIIDITDTPVKDERKPAKFVGPTNFYGQSAKPKPKPTAPIHDATAEGAIVMKSPTEDHIKVYNKKGSPVVPVVIDPIIARHLRPHQVEGVKFLYESVMGLRKHEGTGCILADEMGLGKTLQTIALIWTLLKQNPYAGQGGVTGKVLVVCPVSLVKNWTKEFHKWLGKDRIGVFVGDKDKVVIKQFLNSKIHQVLVIGYERLRSVITDLAYCVPAIGLIVCDEGHRLKSANNKTTKMFDALKTRRRVILSGTPIQNDLGEFHAMADFCNPGILEDYTHFRRIYEAPILASRLPNCTKKILELGNQRSKALLDVANSFVLRRDASILSNYLPPKYENVVFVTPTSLQLSMFSKILRADRVDGLIHGSSARSLAVITNLTKLCNSPMLLKNAKKKAASSEDDASDMIGEALSLIPANARADDFSLSGKLITLESILRVIKKETPEKVVIVSHYTATLDIIERFCDRKNYSYHRLDGQTPQAKRQEYVDNFNKTSQLGKFIFLLSAKAGGVGLNLIGASRLVLFDSDWNPSHDLQAMARIHRDGQKLPVFIYRLLVTGTIDEKIFQRQVTKMGLSESLIGNQQTSEKGKSKSDSFSHKDLKDLFTIVSDTICNTHDILGCDCLHTDKSLLDDEDDDDEEDGGDEKMSFIAASQVNPTEIDRKAAKTKKDDLAALDEWNHINCLQTSAAKDEIQDVVLQRLLYTPPANPLKKAAKPTPVFMSRVDALLAAVDHDNVMAAIEEPEVTEVALTDVPGGTMTFLFQKKQTASL